MHSIASAPLASETQEPKECRPDKVGLRKL